MAKTETPKTSALMKALKPSKELAAIVGAEPLPRTETTKRLWGYIKQHGRRTRPTSATSCATPSSRP